MTPQQEYDAKIVATSFNLRQFLNQSIGVITSSQKGDIPEEDALGELDKLETVWSKLIVDDLSPKKTIIVKE